MGAVNSRSWSVSTSISSPEEGGVSYGSLVHVEAVIGRAIFE